MITLEELCKNLPSDRSKYVGAYVLTHAKTGAVYIGSSGQLGVRMKRHLRHLRNGYHESKKLQTFYKDDPCFHVFTYLTEDREKAYECEQELMDHHLKIGSQLLNTSLNSRFTFANRIYEPISEETRLKMQKSNKETWERPGHIEKMRTKGLERHKDPKFREKYLKAIANRRPHSKEDVEKRSARAREATSKPVSVNGVTYQNVKQAGLALNLSSWIVKWRCRSKNKKFENWFYV